MGRWLDTNGEAIYGTEPSPLWFPDITWRATTKPGKLYLHILNWPDQPLRIEGIESEVTKAAFLASGDEVTFRKDGNALVIDLPAEPVDEYVTVIALDIADQQPRIADGFRADQIPEQIDLYAWAARFRGEELRYDWETSSATNFEVFERENNELFWFNYGALDGNFEVELEYACPNNAAGSKLNVRSGPRTGDGETRIETTVAGTGGNFTTLKLDGTVRLDEGAHNILRLGLTGDDKSAAMQIRKVRLTKVN
jgi:hypothetical protein